MLEKGNTPEEVNIFKCFLIFKVEGGDSKQPGQYRPIPIPSNILRLLTVRMCEKMTSIVEEQGLLGEEQFGFRRKRSTTDACFVFNTLVQKAKRKG